jgi:hypothetical protein
MNAQTRASEHDQWAGNVLGRLNKAAEETERRNLTVANRDLDYCERNLHRTATAFHLEILPIIARLRERARITEPVPASEYYRLYRGPCEANGFRVEPFGGYIDVENALRGANRQAMTLGGEWLVAHLGRVVYHVELPAPTAKQLRRRVRALNARAWAEWTREQGRAVGSLTRRLETLARQFDQDCEAHAHYHELRAS